MCAFERSEKGMEFNMNKLNVLSLFDGISCGRIALERANIEVNKYYASEINEYAIKIAKKNYPDTIQLGDVRELKKENISDKIDLIIGGSPCQSFSFVGHMDGMSATENGNKREIVTLEEYLNAKENGYVFNGYSYLFWEYVRLLKEIKPKYFLLENVNMTKHWENVITKALGIEPIRINSALFSAQNRNRLYWTNLPIKDYPSDSNVSLKSILLEDNEFENVGDTMTVQKSLPKLQKKYGYIPKMFNAYNVSEITQKSPTLSLGSMVTSSCATTIFIKNENGCYNVKNNKININSNEYITDLDDGKYILRKLTPIECERLQTLPDNYTDGVSDCQRYKMIGNGWTVDAIKWILGHYPNQEE